MKNVQRGYFLGSSQDELKCTAKAPGESEYWLVHLAARPQVCTRRNFHFIIYVYLIKKKYQQYNSISHALRKNVRADGIITY